MSDTEELFIQPDWSLGVEAFSTTRLGGGSRGVYQGLNVGDHVGDESAVVAANRVALCTLLHCPTPPAWLRQTHSNVCVLADDGPQAGDASVTRTPGVVCVVMSADCLPILISNIAGNEVAAVHAGWRGLSNGVIANTLSTLKSAPEDLHVWLGPAIGPLHFEVRKELLQAFPEDKDAFIPYKDRWLADIYQLAKAQLRRHNISKISGGQYCTYSDEKHFFSHRRDGQTGRMASLIWFNE